MEFHELCNLLPEMTDEQFEALKNDIQVNGLLHPVTTYQGYVLDGKHRLRACEALGIEPHFEEYTGGDPAGFVLSENVRRRHLSKGQAAIAAAKLKEYYAKEAKERMASGGGDKKSGVQKFAHPIPNAGKARDKAGEQFGVSGSTVDDAEMVLKNGVPELVKKVAMGEISVNQGRKIAEMRDKKRQVQIASLPSASARSHEIQKSVNRSTSKKKAEMVTKTSVTTTDVSPGTALVKTMLSRLEVMANEIERSGMSVEDYAQAFIRELDWSNELLERRFRYVAQAIECVSIISTATKGKLAA